MKQQPDTSSGKEPFAVFVLSCLRKAFLCLSSLQVSETEKDGIRYFRVKTGNICLYNAYPEGVQLVFNRRLLTGHFHNAYDFSEKTMPDWALIITLINDIAEKIPGHRTAPDHSTKNGRRQQHPAAKRPRRAGHTQHHHKSGDQHS